MIKVVVDFEGEVNGALTSFVVGDTLTKEQSEYFNAIDKGLAERSPGIAKKEGVKYAES